MTFCICFVLAITSISSPREMQTLPLVLPNLSYTSTTPHLMVLMVGAHNLFYDVARLSISSKSPSFAFVSLQSSSLVPASEIRKKVEENLTPEGSESVLACNNSNCRPTDSNWKKKFFSGS